MRSSWPPLFLLVVSMISLVGCKPRAPEFGENLLFVNRLERESGGSLEFARNDIRDCLEALFGTPDDPRWPEIAAWRVDSERLRRAAGPTGRAQDGIERGLWRKHCATCHGISGDGAGPAAALLAPYPRDFRRGSFKFKSTPIGTRPTRNDLKRIVEKGIPGTSMPSFQSLSRSPHLANDIDDLVEYVIYLSVRGEMERQLLSLVALELDESVRVYDAAIPDGTPAHVIQQNRIRSLLDDVLSPWSSAESRVTPVASQNRANWTSADWSQSVERGRAWFNSQTTACASCHGAEGKGDGQTQDFDEWTKDWTVRAGIDPLKPEEWKPLKRLGALKPVKDPPRNFHYGAFRGGSDPHEIYRRIVNGIEGTPMPAVARRPDNAQGIAEEEVWDLVHFVLSLHPGSLPFESAGQGRTLAP